MAGLAGVLQVCSVISLWLTKGNGLVDQQFCISQLLISAT